MTSKREDREALIEEAADAIERTPWRLGTTLRTHRLDTARNVLAVFEQAHTPTDDEREALIEEATWVLIDWDTDIVDRGVRDEHYRERRADVERVFPILFRRPVQGEPATRTAVELEVPGDAPTGVAVQGEPTAETTRAVAKAINVEGWTAEGGEHEPGCFCEDCERVCTPIALAALRAAAAGQGGENRG